MKLAEWRGEIDAIDDEIVALLERRAKIARKIGVLKANAGLPVVDLGREENIIRQVSAKNSDVLSQESLARIYHRILQESRLVQVEAITALNGNRIEVH